MAVLWSSTKRDRWNPALAVEATEAVEEVEGLIGVAVVEDTVAAVTEGATVAMIAEAIAETTPVDGIGNS